MTREDLFSGLLLLLISLSLWCCGLGRGMDDPAAAELPSAAHPADQFGAGRSAFRLAAPATWMWKDASGTAADEGWTPIGGFSHPEATLAVSWRRLEREVRVEDYLDYECRRLQFSVQRVLPAEGRRPRVEIAEVWRTEGGTRREGLLALSKLGSRLFRLEGWSTDAAALREAVESFQPLGAVASSCAEPLSVWRPVFRGPLAVSYPAGWSIQEATAWRGMPVLHLRSRLGGKVRGAMLVFALYKADAEDERVGACIDDLCRALAECEPEVGAAGAQLMADTDASSARLEGPGRFRLYRAAHGKESWEIRVRVLSGSKCAVGVVETGPTREVDAQAWMVNRGAFEVVSESAGGD